ncbi:hypothetical protein UCMB321_3652 [Pseudomonas batumici]|uniref:Uncharacterized protein n=1 Tax=Pseudomonas batumici TaxID=226910 RepID=A0A0C2E9Y6_9PSED|nr:hypothetical protein UCMB321_3652 [Pseudomonas batumici]
MRADFVGVGEDSGAHRVVLRKIGMTERGLNSAGAQAWVQTN